MPLTLVIYSDTGEASRLRLQPGRNRVTVRVGDRYHIVDGDSGRTPPNLVVHQIDNSLIIDGLAPGEADPPVVELAEFYTLCSAGSPCTLLVDAANGGAPVAITPGTPPIGALADGAFVLYDPAWTAPAAPDGSDSSVGLRYGLYGLGGLAVVGLAAGGGGGGGGGKDGSAISGGGQPAPPDGTLKLVSSDYNTRKPVIAGEGEPGAQLTVRLDVNGDGAVDVTYQTTVGDDYRWSIDLATATPVSGSLPADGLRDTTALTITSNGAAGAVTLAPTTIRFDDVPPAPARIDPVAGDGTVTGPEKAAGIVVSGTAEAGATVLLDWAGQTATATADGSGRWSVRFAAANVPADGESTISATVRDSAGNQSGVTTIPVAVDTRPALLGVSAIAGDGIVSLADGDSFRFTGTAEAGARVTVGWNGIERTATAGGDGQWAIEYAGPELPLVDATRIAYSITATNLIGNVATLGGSVLVDRIAPNAPTIDPVSGDDRVTQAERAAGVTVSGTAGAGERVTVTWGGTAHTAEADAAGRWTSRFGSSELPAVGSPGADTVLTAQASDAAGNAGPAVGHGVYVELPFTPPTIDVVAGNDVVNAVERGGGIVLSGAVAANAPGVVVTWGGWSGQAGVSGGRWQVTVPAGQVPGDGNAEVVATIAGYPGVSSARMVAIDTTPPPGPGIAPVTGDNSVTAAERTGPVTIAGSAEAGATISVQWGGATLSTVADGSGAWQVTFAAGQIPSGPAGTSASTVTATATDAAGNTGSPTHLTVELVTPFGPPTIAAIETDNVINAAERADGVVIHGTVAAGAPGVQVDWGGFSGVAAVAGNTWSITVPADRVPGDGASTVTATVAGPAGGAASGHAVVVDTMAPAAPQLDPVTGDDSISPIENLFGFEVSGTSEAGARIDVTIGGASRSTTADGGGHWSVGPVGPFGAGPLTISALATDAAGNTGGSTSRTIDVLSPGTAIGPQSPDDPLLNLLA